ncbi:E3 ubiquitin-protein ligase RING1-like [Diospyros lotus]|uniref:E3 ubiquitin-protein ligase RING1-like n=1 Tax=Diospyros lotus TaxID=55363 RepID=UPI00224FC044|nr:E3 ubiquitin-protein ligase RING1-like [Diospyros lotus]
MASAGGPVAGRGPQLYFCYQCERTVTLTPSPNFDLLCPSCNGGFLEEWEQDRSPNPNNPGLDSLDPFSAFPDPLSDFLTGLPLLLSSSSSTSLDLQNPSAFSNIFDQRRALPLSQDPERFDPYAFLQNHLANLVAGGANIEFMIANQPSDQGFRPPLNLGDYVVGPGLEQLIQQLAENDPNRYGTPPAAKSAIKALPRVTVDDELLSSDLAQCAVCKDDFERDMEVKQMPCKHVYHPDCIVPWLELHNSCPVCRYELPTDDPEYENPAPGSTGSGNPTAGSGSDAGTSEGSSPGQRTVERRFRISLAWPFGSAGSGAGGGSNTGGQQNRGMGSERQEDLD